MAVLRRSATRWRRFALGTIAALAALAAFSVLVWVYCVPRALEIAGKREGAAMANLPAPEINLLLLPDKPVAAGRPIHGWTIYLGDYRRQSVAFDAVDPGAPGFILRCAGFGKNPLSRFHAFFAGMMGVANEIRLVSDPIPVKQGMKLQLFALCRKSDDFSGSLSFEVLLMRNAGNDDFSPEDMERLLVKEANQPRRDGWFSAQQTFDVPARGSFAALLVHGRFQGSLQIKGLRLACRETGVQSD